MAEETLKDAPEIQEAPAAVGRFRLPKLFADASDASAGEEAAPANSAAPANGGPVNGSLASGSDAPSNEDTASSGAEHTPPMFVPNPHSPAAILLHEIGQVRDGMELMYRAVTDLSERESSREKVFDTLYTELREYKNDFIYEHLKPVVRPLLFLYDSLEQFDTEVTQMILPPEAERRQLSPAQVRQNMSYFMDQLAEALRVCEVTPMDKPEGVFNPKLHKAVEIVAVDAEHDNTVQRVVRGGWYLNGQLLRPAEVVIGRASK